MAFEMLKFEPADRFLVVGLGLLGARYALGLTEAGWYVSGVNRSRPNLEFALEHGYIRQGKTGDYADLVASADYIILAQNPASMVEWARQWTPHCKPGCLITDLAGVKGGLVEPLQALLPAGVEFIGSHPMAGRELSGAANAALVDFAPANFIITPTETNTPRAVAFARALAGTSTIFIRRSSPSPHSIILQKVFTLQARSDIIIHI